MVSRFDTLYYCLCSLATYMTSIGIKKIFFVSMPTKKIWALPNIGNGTTSLWNFFQYTKNIYSF